MGRSISKWRNLNLDMCDKDPVLGPVFKKAWVKYNLEAYLTYYVKDEDMDPEDPQYVRLKVTK